MRRGGGKQKGAAFEREVCVMLSKWLSNGVQEDLFWRSAMSGGRATVAHKNTGKRHVNQVGDISAIGNLGFSLTNRFFIEVKTYKNLDFTSALNGKGKLIEFWKIAKHEARKFKLIPLLIVKQNRLPIILGTNDLGIHFLKSESKIQVFLPQQGLHLCLFENILNTANSNSRLLMYDYTLAVRDFYHQKRGACERQIDFDFSFEEWIVWWENELGSTWQKLRGRNKGQYVMARYYDNGPYAPWNVKCITQEENASERKVNGTAARGTKVWTNKLSEKQVIEIFNDDRHPKELAEIYPISIDMVWRIKKKKSWQYLLNGVNKNVVSSGRPSPNRQRKRLI